MGLYKRKDSKYWWMWLEPIAGGQPKMESTKVRFDATTKEQRKNNRDLAEQIYHRRAAEYIGAAKGLQPKPTITFDAYAQWYETHVTPTHGSHATERSCLAQLRRWFKSTPLHQIDRAAVLEWRTDRTNHVTPVTADRDLDVLKSVLASAVPKYLEQSPIKGLKRHRETVQSKKRRPRILDQAEELRLLKAAKDPAAYALIVLALDTLMRLADVRELRRDRDYGTYIHVEAPKVYPYDVPVSRRLRKALDALPKDGPFYFPRRWSGRPGGISANTVWHLFKKLCQAAKVPVGRDNRGVTFHSLRHTGTTRMLERGVNPLAVMEIGGWQELRQLTRYGRASEESKRRAVNLVAPTRGLRRSRKH